jgi:hypothetical protein
MTANDIKKLALAASILSLAACSGAANPSGFTPPTASGPNTPQAEKRLTDAVESTSATVEKTYDEAVLAYQPFFLYETSESSGTVAVDSSQFKINGIYVAPLTLGTPGCCGNAAVTFSLTDAGKGKPNSQLTSPIQGTDTDFTRPFTVGMSMRPTGSSYPGYGTYWFAGTDVTENLSGYGWDFTYGNNNSTKTAGYNLNWHNGGSAHLIYAHALLTGTHQWVVDVTSSTVSLFLDGTSVASAALTSSFENKPGRENLSFGNTVLNENSTFNCACAMSGMFFIRNALTSAQIAGLQTAAANTPKPTPTPVPTATPVLDRTYDESILAYQPFFLYETGERSGTVAVDSSQFKINGLYIPPTTFSATGCCGNAGVTFSTADAGKGRPNAQLTSPIQGGDTDFTRPFTVGMSITPTVQSYPGYGTYWFAGTDTPENQTGYGWDFTYGNDNATKTAGYNLNWHDGGSSDLLYAHALLTGNHQWVVNVTSSTVSLYLDGTSVASAPLSASFENKPGRENLSFGNIVLNDKATFNCACAMSSMYFIRNALTSEQIAGLETAALQDTPTPAPTATPIVVTPLAYNSSTACINHALFTNNVLPANVGEFSTSGFNTAYWGGLKTRTEPPAATWGPGYNQSWGRHQYATNMGDPSQGAGFPNPFAVVDDQGTQALRIAAFPVPTPIATSLNLMNNDQYIAAHSEASFAIPSEGGSLALNVDNVNGAQIGWKVGVGFAGGPYMFVGTLTSGGARASVGTGGSNPWTITKIHIYKGTPGTVLVPSVNPNDYAIRTYNFPAYYSGTLDTNVNQEYGFFVARLRLPSPAPGLSPAFWMLETGGVKTNEGQILRSEWDTEEQFGSVYGGDLNAGNILWNSGDNGKWYSYGCGLSCGPNGESASGATGVYPWPSTGSDSSGYHDYGVLISPGGPAFPTNFSGSLGGDYTASNSPYVGTTFYVDGVPVAGHVGAPDLTQGSPDKEIMLMFQIAGPGTFLDPKGLAKDDVWPEYLYAQWLRVYKPGTSSC